MACTRQLLQSWHAQGSFCNAGAAFHTAHCAAAPEAQPQCRRVAALTLGSSPASSAQGPYRRPPHVEHYQQSWHAQGSFCAAFHTARCSAAPEAPPQCRRVAALTVGEQSRIQRTRSIWSATPSPASLPDGGDSSGQGTSVYGFICAAAHASAYSLLVPRLDLSVAAQACKTAGQPLLPQHRSQTAVPAAARARPCTAPSAQQRMRRHTACLCHVLI